MTFGSELDESLTLCFLAASRCNNRAFAFKLVAGVIVVCGGGFVVVADIGGGDELAACNLLFEINSANAFLVASCSSSLFRSATEFPIFSNGTSRLDSSVTSLADCARFLAIIFMKNAFFSGVNFPFFSIISSINFNFGGSSGVSGCCETDGFLLMITWFD